ncbi:esterase [Erythrobacter arachoides]|uniref:Esterase n=2 Tax=Aurantiacibacter arachoides TaxID=1850444 RepID=A0A845A3H2_9SPHN|nr:esterase [Aurantiacibacter arachoides]
MPAFAQEGAAPRTCRDTAPFQPMDYRSVEPLADGRVTFRLCAPNARAVRVISNDLDPWVPAGFGGGERGLAMVRDTAGLWSATTALPVPADTYRYNFEIDGAKVPDPMASTFSRERTGVNSTFEMPGEAGAFQSYRADVPHGIVSRVEYASTALGAVREAYVYTPPGYMAGTGRYPVLYLVHGAGDSADSWSSVGHANYIADNLLAAGEAEAMIIVMPFGHTPQGSAPNMLVNTAFGEDLTTDLVPFIDATFRTLPDADHRAMAGLSMGGAHTLNFGVTRPDLFGEVGVFSMGLGFDNPDAIASYTRRNADALARRAASTQPVYYAMGRDDFLYASAAPTLALFEANGIPYDYNESDGGHTWINWRRYLHDFLPRLFR